MKENALSKIVNHVDKDEIIAKLVLNISPEEINSWLKDKYAVVGDSKLIIGVATLKKFKNEYLDLYNTIRNDAMALQQYEGNIEINKDPLALVNSNKEYRRMLQEYLEQEVDLKVLVKELIVAVRARLEQLFVLIQQNPMNTKPDYVLIQWFQTLTTLLEKQETIINGGSEKIVQQNNINIQILDQHIETFHKVIREVLSRLDYETSLLFTDVLTQELQKIKPIANENLPLDVRLSEAKKLEHSIIRDMEKDPV